MLSGQREFVSRCGKKERKKEKKERKEMLNSKK
jgi:N-dimethylarginine dimethylaminohydrolase